LRVSEWLFALASTGSAHWSVHAIPIRMASSCRLMRDGTRVAVSRACQSGHVGGRDPSPLLAGLLVPFAVDVTSGGREIGFV